MNILLWTLQILLALAFLLFGGTKIAVSRDKLRERMAWVDHFSTPMVRFIGVMETLGALGLLLPAATDIASILTPLAATGIGTIMIGAMVTHTRLREYSGIVVNLALLAIAAVIAWGRFGPYPL
jgi:hypothetical protein